VISAPNSSLPARRAGTALLELLVAIPVLAIVGLAAVAVLLAAHRQARLNDGRQGSARELRHGGLVMAWELRPLQPTDLIAWSDTSIEFNSLVGSGVACDTRDGRRTVHMLPSAGADPARTAWITPPESNDRVTLWLGAPTTTSTATRWDGVVRSVGASAACASSLLRLEPGRAIRLALRDSLPRDLQDGSPVRVTRRVRYALYRGADGFWYLGRRAFDGTAWDVAQPVVGPLLSAARGGVTITVTDSASTPLPTGAPNAAGVSIRFRAPRAGMTPQRVDTSLTTVALRGRDDE